MENIFGTIVNVTFGAIGLFLLCGILLRLFKDLFAVEKQVQARVTDKQKYSHQSVGHLQAPRTEEKYIVTFQCEKGKLHFEVSPFSYEGYKINQTGVLKYKGSRIISFEN